MTQQIATAQSQTHLLSLDMPHLQTGLWTIAFHPHKGMLLRKAKAQELHAHAEESSNEY
jgi:hypothetical protein